MQHFPKCLKPLQGTLTPDNWEAYIFTRSRRPPPLRTSEVKAPFLSRMAWSEVLRSGEAGCHISFDMKQVMGPGVSESPHISPGI